MESFQNRNQDTVFDWLGEDDNIDLLKLPSLQEQASENANVEGDAVDIPQKMPNAGLAASQYVSRQPYQTQHN